MRFGSIPAKTNVLYFHHTEDIMIESYSSCHSDTYEYLNFMSLGKRQICLTASGFSILPQAQ